MLTHRKEEESVTTLKWDLKSVEKASFVAFQGWLHFGAPIRAMKCNHTRNATSTSATPISHTANEVIL